MEAHIPVATSLMNITCFLKGLLFVPTTSQSVWRAARSPAKHHSVTQRRGWRLEAGVKHLSPWGMESRPLSEAVREGNVQQVDILLNLWQVATQHNFVCVQLLPVATANFITNGQEQKTDVCDSHYWHLGHLDVCCHIELVPEDCLHLQTAALKTKRRVRSTHTYKWF